MKKIIILFLLYISISANASTDKYRLIWRDNPSTTICVGFNAISGSDHRVYWDVVDQGTDTTLYSNVQYPDTSNTFRGMNNEFVRITGLSANTAYYFVVADDEGVSQRFWFKTSPDVQTERIPVIMGGDSRNNQVPRQNANLMVSKLKPLAVFFAGDMISNGWSDADWQEWFDDWQLTIATNGRIFPVVPALGNHESAADLKSHVKLFDVPSNDSYFALSFGGDLFRLYTLNSEISVAGNQRDWLENDLEENAFKYLWKIAQYHTPVRPHTLNKPNNNDQYDAWCPLFYEYQMNLVNECDAHLIKVTKKVSSSTAPGNIQGFIEDADSGTVYIGEGGWGAPLRPYTNAKSWTECGGSFNHFSWVFIDDTKIEIRTIEIDNAATVGENTDANPFAIPANLNIFNCNGSGVVTLDVLGFPSAEITSPSDGASLPPAPQNVTITAEAMDLNGTIDKVEFYINDALVGTVFGATGPYQHIENFTSDGLHELYTKSYDSDGKVTKSKVVKLYVGYVTTSSCFATIDDAEEKQDGTLISIPEEILELGDAGGVKLMQTVGFRYDNLNLPPNAIIHSAYIQFTAYGSSSTDGTLTIQGERTANSAVFVNEDFNISARSKTTSSVDWVLLNSNTWLVNDASGTPQQTPDISAILSEIINDCSWSENNALNIMIKGSGLRKAHSLESSPAKAAKLCVTFVVPSTGPEPPDPSTCVASLIELNPMQYTLYPNPAKDYVNIIGAMDVVKEVTITSLDGKKQYASFTKGENQLEVSLEGLKNGIYVLSIETSEGLIRKRVTIVN